MKTLKLIPVVILFTIALVNTANADGAKTNPITNTIKLTHAEAVQSPGLVNAMHEQLCAESLGGPGVQHVTLKVTYRNHFYLITGTYYQWLVFFKVKPIVEKHKQPVN